MAIALGALLPRLRHAGSALALGAIAAMADIGARPVVPGVRAQRRYAAAFSTSVTLCPPNAKEFDSATGAPLADASGRASPGT